MFVFLGEVLLVAELRVKDTSLGGWQPHPSEIFII